MSLVFNSARSRFQQSRAISRITAVGGIVGFEHEWDSSRNCMSGREAPGPRWLRRALGDTYFATVCSVIFDSVHVAVGTVAQLGYLKTLKELGIVDCNLDRDALFQLHDIPNLTYLSLCGTPLNAADVKVLQSLNRLNTLVVTGTGLDDDSVELLRRSLADCQTFFEAEYSGPVSRLLNEVQ